MSDIVIMAETGSDIPAAEAAELGIELVPMHVSIGTETIDDGTLPPAEMLERCRQLVVMPKTSGCTPADFEAALARVEAARPGAEVLYLAYSAATTCSYESALQVAGGRPGFRALDTTHVTIGQGFVVRATARRLAEDPDVTLDELYDFAADASARMRMGFIPGDLGYLRSGGRLSNAGFIGATLLRIKPVIELVDGRLVATKKFRGSMQACCLRLIDHMALQGDFLTDEVDFVRSPGLPLAIQQAADEHARELGFRTIRWYDTQNVITSHCGPGSFAVAMMGA